LLLGTLGSTLGALGVCPVVKWIWTPSWVLFSGGFCFLFLAAFHASVDLGGTTWAVFPLVVIGMNSFVAYVVARIYPAVAFNSLRRIVGNTPFRVFGDAFDPFVYGCVVLAGYWMFLFILYRKRIFVRL
jgi:heparan-alpha-glucosaminide N-acetyltransferase